MIFKTIMVVYVILVIYKTIELYKYNENGYVMVVKGDNEYYNAQKGLNPFVYTYHHDINYNMMIKEKPSYLINHGNDLFPLKSFKEESSLNVYKNKKIIESFLLKEKFVSLKGLKDYRYLFPKIYSLSLLKGNISIPLQTCNHNYNIIGNLEGESIVYLFNPKHKEDMIDKDNHEIKKWGHRIVFKKDDVLFIPTGWSYIQEVSGETIQYHIDVDSIFTFIPNFVNDIKNNY
jgi:hypothetical protein